MARATGIGGVFFKCQDPDRLRDWYVENLMLPLDEDGYVVLRWGGHLEGTTVWGPFPADTSAFGWPDHKQWVINYRVDDLHGLLSELRLNNVEVEEEIFTDENGVFGHCWDPEGNLIQLWEPNPGM